MKVLLVVLILCKLATVKAQEPLRKIIERKYPENTLFVGATSSYNMIGTKESKILAREFSYTTPANDFKQGYIYYSDRKLATKVVSILVSNQLNSNAFLSIVKCSG